MRTTQQVVGHHLSELENADFVHAVGLIRKTKAAKSLRKFIMDLFELANDPDLLIESANSARHSVLSTCNVGDIVLLRNEGGLSAGHVWKFVSLLDEHLVLVEELTLVSRNRRCRSANFCFTGEHMVYYLKDVIDPVVYSHLGNDTVRAILPADLADRLH